MLDFSRNTDSRRIGFPVQNRFSQGVKNIPLKCWPLFLLQIRQLHRHAENPLFYLFTFVLLDSYLVTGELLKFTELTVMVMEPVWDDFVIWCIILSYINCAIKVCFIISRSAVAFKWTSSGIQGPTRKHSPYHCTTSTSLNYWHKVHLVQTSMLLTPNYNLAICTTICICRIWDSSDEAHNGFRFLFYDDWRRTWSSGSLLLVYLLHFMVWCAVCFEISAYHELFE